MQPAIQFLNFNHLPDCRAWVDKTFPDYFGLNFARVRRVVWSMDGGRSIELSGPAAWWTWPGPRFAYGNAEASGWDHSYATFRGRWATDLLEMPELFPRERPWQWLRDGERVAERMRAVLAALGVHDELAAWSVLLEILVLLRDERGSRQTENPREQHMDRMIREIRMAPGLDWLETDCARELALSPAHFRRLFRQAAGHPFHRYLLRARMLDAARRLRSGGESIKEIAESCRAGDIYQFTRSFRAVIGQPPAAYRRQSRLQGA